MVIAVKLLLRLLFWHTAVNNNGLDTTTEFNTKEPLHTLKTQVQIILIILKSQCAYKFK